MIRSSIKVIGLILVFLVISCQENKSINTRKIVLADGSVGNYEYILEHGDTILDGNFSIHDKDGKLKRQGRFIKNKFYGIYKDFYPNGKIESIRFRDNNKEVGEITWYRNNGKLDTYSFYDDLGRVNFIAKYDSKGNIDNAKGLILFEIYQFKLRKKTPKVYYNVGDTVKYQFMLPHIPNTNRKFNFRLKDFDNSKIVRESKNIEPVTIEVKDIAIKKGKNTIMAKVEYQFKDETKIILKDSISFDYYVK